MLAGEQQGSGISTTHSWAPSGPWIAAQGSSIPQAESLGTSPGLQQGAEASLPAANSAEPEAEEAGSMRESDLSSIPGFRSPSVSQEQAPPAAKPTPASTPPGAPILNHLVEEKGGGFVTSGCRSNRRQRRKFSYRCPLKTWLHQLLPSKPHGVGVVGETR